MRFIDKYKFSLLIVIPLLILVLLYATSGNHFQKDAEKWASPSFSSSNTIEKGKLGNLSENLLMITFGNAVFDTEPENSRMLQCDPENLFDKDNWKIIKSHSGPFLIVSDNSSLSSRMWMILSQRGLKNVYILVSEAKDEVLKYKFRPDSISDRN